MSDQDIYLLWLRHQSETGEETHKATVFYSDAGLLIGWRCETCDQQAGMMPR